MSKKGLLNPQFNRVRTSGALKSNDMWEKMIGVTEERGTNEAIEASIRAPTRGGVDKEERRQRAQALIDASGYKPVVTDYKGLMSLARAQGNTSGNTSRGACKLCGGLGHRTKQCTNFLSGHSGASGDVDVVGGAPAGAVGLLGLLPDPDEDDDSDLGLSDLDSGSSSSSSSDSDSDSDSSDGERRKRKRSRKDKKSKKKHKRDSSTSEKKSKKSRKDEKKHKKEKKKKEKKEKSRH